jgi:hypothetical protein
LIQLIAKIQFNGHFMFQVDVYSKLHFNFSGYACGHVLVRKYHLHCSLIEAVGDIVGFEVWQNRPLRLQSRRGLCP